MSDLSNRLDKRYPSLLIRRAQCLTGGLSDMRIENGIIAALDSQLEPRTKEPVIDALGNLLLPGLHDHHLHLFATAAARASLFCGPPAVCDEQGLIDLLECHADGSGDWIRGIGFHESVCPTLNRQWLDRICPRRPVRIQHRSGRLWILNSLALQQLEMKAGEPWPDGVETDVNGEPTGRFYHLDHWLGERLPRRWPALASLSRELARYGITAVTDTGVNNGREEWAALQTASKSGQLSQRLLVMGNEQFHHLHSAHPDWIDVGPLKIYLRESQLPDLEVLAGRIGQSHTAGRQVAFHCVTRVELHVALAALAEAGVMPGDRIEHASVADDYTLERLAALGVTVVTQPHFITERGDQYLQDVDTEDIPLLYRAAAFLRGGVALAAGSDAPYGLTDPWAAMRAAVMRRTAGGRILSADEQLTPLQALGLFGGEQRRPGTGLRQLAVGQAADLCLLDVPWDVLRNDLDARHVALTMCGGNILYRHEEHHEGQCEGHHAGQREEAK